jgi:hypothetical protein
MKKGSKRRVLKKTMIFVGEGEAEKAFISHLRSLYCVGGLRVTPKSAGGKGPNNVLNDAICTLTKTGCDFVATLLDTDIPWPPELVKEANAKGVHVIGSKPCLEGLLLKILGKSLPRPATSDACKKRMHSLLSGKETDKSSYEELFTKSVLDESAKKVPELKLMIDLLSGKLST